MTLENSSPQDLGFGDKITKVGERLIKKDGSFNIIRTGDANWNAYQTLIELPVGRFVLVSLFFFILINAFFACLLLLVGVEQLNGVPDGSAINDFLYAFFFSIQTFTTVGYGGINPIGITANFVASLCATIGLIAFALITGLFFARFSRPRSNIAFSEKAIISPYQDIQSFQCRAVNQRDHKIIDLSARLVMTWLETQKDGFKRQYAQLELERDNVFLFPLNWTIVHPITADSPLYSKTIKDLELMQAEFLVMLTGYDESYNQVIHSNTSYIVKELEWGVKFKPMYSFSDEAITTLYLDDLDTLLPM